MLETFSGNYRRTNPAWGALPRKEVIPTQLSSAPVIRVVSRARGRFELSLGAPFSEPHVDRKFSALEAIEKKQIPQPHRC